MNKHDDTHKKCIHEAEDAIHEAEDAIHEPEDAIHEPEDAIDCEWINNFNTLESQYIKYYKDTPRNVKIKILYVDKQNNVERIINKKLQLNNEGILSKSKLVGLIYKNKNITYRLRNILKYNFTIDAEDINKFMRKNDAVNNNNAVNEYLINYDDNILDIKFNKTIQVLQPINTLFLIFKCKEQQHNKTKKVYKLQKIQHTRRNLGYKSI